MDTDKKLVWSYGGGTQSLAIAVLILKGKLPMPDYICIADTGREVQTTWDYLEEVVRPAGFDVHVIPHSYATVDLTSKKGSILIPAYTTQNGNIGKLPTYCSTEWKQRPVRRWLREQGVVECDLWLGMSTDEMVRMKESDKKWINHVYPLIEIVPTSRHQCVSIVEGFGWPPPPKSRCHMCPNMRPADWKELRDNEPEDFQKAVEFDQELRVLDENMYLHPTAKPLEEGVAESDQQMDMFDFDGCDSGFCWS